MNEELAVELCRRGEEDGFSELFARYSLPAGRLAYALTGNRALADDVLQDAFIQAFRSIGNLQQGRPFGPWFYAIVANRARRIMSRSRWTRWLPLPAADLPDTEASRSLESAEERSELWEAVRALPAEYREALIMRYLLDLSEEAMAEALGVAPGTVKSRLSRARQKLAKRLSKNQLYGEGIAWTPPTR